MQRLNLEMFLRFSKIFKELNPLSLIMYKYKDFFLLLITFIKQRMDFDVLYLGPAQIVVEVIVGGSKVNVKMPILITDIDIKG